MKLSDCHYDKIKLLYKFSTILHFIKKHAVYDARDAEDEKFHRFLDDLEDQLEKYVTQLNDMIGQ